jgi:phosphomannomutase
VIPAGRSETFVPIDTENIGAPQLATIQSLANEATAKHGPLFAVVSTDGDSDRPLVLGVNSATGNVRFFGGDLLGMVVAKYLRADAVVVPITCNDAIDRGELAPVLEPKTRIGSPFVIAGMEQARTKGKQRVCGWEPNGGFLTATDLSGLTALPTRDAMLPILGVLFAAVERGKTLVDVFAELPARFSRAALLPSFPRALGEKVAALRDLARFFPAEAGFGKITHVDYTDGVRISFDNGDVAHVRPSGNADELRIYAVADTQARADAIAALGVAEPDGILRSMAVAAEHS